MFAEHEMQVDDLENFVGVARRSGTELFQTCRFRFDARIAGVLLPGVVDESADALQNGAYRDVESVEIRPRSVVKSAVLLPFRAETAGPVAQSGKSERENRIPVRNRMVEIFPHEMEPGGIALQEKRVGVFQITFRYLVIPLRDQR